MVFTLTYFFYSFVYSSVITSSFILHSQACIFVFLLLCKMQYDTCICIGVFFASWWKGLRKNLIQNIIKNQILASKQMTLCFLSLSHHVFFKFKYSVQDSFFSYLMRLVVRLLKARRIPWTILCLKMKCRIFFRNIWK
jgi:hypothetical protein